MRLIVGARRADVATLSFDLVVVELVGVRQHRVGLVVATLTGGTQAQTWANVGRALEAADGVLAEDGAIAICTNLEEKPGQSLAPGE